MTFDLRGVMETLRREVGRLPQPSVTVLAGSAATPFAVLVATVISLRTKDAVTAAAAARLLARAPTPAALARLEVAAIANAIYPAGFYKTKAAALHAMAERLVREFGGQVPRELETLLTFKGVGRKTANLVLTLGHGLPGICVDTHVHRITNRWGFVRTRTPEATEAALRRKLPRQYWQPINDWLVAWGQAVCVPVSPKCSQCALAGPCRRRGVTRSR